MTPRYPEERAGPFPEPPRSVRDASGREIRMEPAGAADVEALVAMYERFDPADRAQGIPPVRREAIERWLETLLEEEESLNVVARDGDEVVGHATLVPDREGGYELAIFVLGEYQGAGIGTGLLETLLGHGRDAGVDRVWLTVERWNDAAIALYEKVGFQRTDGERFEVEMAIRL